MKLKIDLIKSLLEVIENSLNFPEPIFNRDIQLDGVDSVTILYHLCQMADAGLIHAYESKEIGNQYIVVYRLTSEGHAFLANAQNHRAWDYFKIASRSMGSFSLGIAKTTLADITRQVAAQAARSAIKTG